MSYFDILSAADSAVLRFEMFGNCIIFSPTNPLRVSFQDTKFFGLVITFGKQIPRPQFMTKSVTLFALQPFF
jgi:hypothetical protein